ncbi:beta-L-arabinofuranosidase domain-containing protein [Adhaeribacter radiodurans]|uniref:Glycoside hydrolase family 127 protein n=1 Tax=Adhaeribacter radiodurans TaxID=2745197 RepID=A0A7L7L6E7_9BACT|nr:beta-L-arabinofuranosidase domain-containing protein [Adhaeribacter radiodurans]QMU27939.1 glycoside hydrolase family 127 protein [Adhaeribacter radiodurans]
MNKFFLLAIIFWYASNYCTATAQNLQEAKTAGKPSSLITKSFYLQNKAPLRPNPYLELPIGAIKPQGWLKEMLIRQKNGASGQLDKLYPLVMNQRNGWLGGDGDQWERGPYWIDGLLPLAYILDDKELIAKTKPWIEWTLKSQDADGYFGPKQDYGPEPGLQRNNSRDWWPKMVMLKILKQYYSATGDKRVITLMTNYFKYQLKELPKNPLDHWTFWARYRGGDNLMVVYWLYNIIGDSFLLDLANLIHQQTFDYTGAFLKGEMLATQGSIHCVNLAQGIKEPLIYYQQHPEQKYLDATNKGFADIRKFNGQAQGLYGGDEALHGNNPTQGSELCSAVEMMFSLESIMGITGQVSFADHLEKIAFNALPTQTTDDYLGRQYFQQANQVMLTRHIRNFDQNHGGTDVCYGLLTGYPCCTSNMHQGWPKFTQNLWYATPDNGLAALVFSPSEVKAKVGNGSEVKFTENTNYPFEEAITFTLTTDKKTKTIAFSFHLRIPEWCKKATITINGKLWQEVTGNQIAVINRTWKSGDVVQLQLPMHLFKTTWYENSMAVERGPITYALKIGEDWKTITNEKDPIAFGQEYMEVRPTTPWNYGLLQVPDNKLEENMQVVKKAGTSIFPWSITNAPVEIKVKAKRIPSWQLYNDMAGPLPYSITSNLETGKEEEEITLIPYGCTTLRISQFPVVRK